MSTNPNINFIESFILNQEGEYYNNQGIKVHSSGGSLSFEKLKGVFHYNNVKMWINFLDGKGVIRDTEPFRIYSNNPTKQSFGIFPISKIQALFTAKKKLLFGMYRVKGIEKSLDMFKANEDFKKLMTNKNIYISTTSDNNIFSVTTDRGVGSENDIEYLAWIVSIISKSI